ncbi:MAG: cytochrome c family protein [bacterium]|nr:cytochrome c family protein [bacterium]
MRQFVSLALLWAINLNPLAYTGDPAAWSQARDIVRAQEEKAYAADPSLPRMQSWLEESERRQRAADFAELRNLTTRYIDAHQHDDALMSAYYALREAERRIAGDKVTREILKDAQLRTGWLEVRRDDLAKADPAYPKATSLAKVESDLLAKLQSEAAKATAKEGEILASHPFPEFVVRYVKRWAEGESRASLATRFINARTPEALKTARGRLELIERVPSERLRESTKTARSNDRASTVAVAMNASPAAVARVSDLPPETGPDLVVLRELEDAYEAVPFDHKYHAKMAQMWNGCVTCHHRSPHPGEETGDEAPLADGERKQENAASVPACKSCHREKTAAGDIRMPSLKAAYHRQCLNCHREWMGENACESCHRPKNARQVAQVGPSPDDIVGRMHPPIPEPVVKAYKTRFTPAAGGNVLFRHREHTVDFGIKCVNCHHRDSCVDCHSAASDASVQKPLRPGMTWNESHAPCIECHARDAGAARDQCRDCHYKDGEAPPQAFDHAATGQGLDKDHVKLACGQCHSDLKMALQPTCGNAACHKNGTVTYPAKRPGPVINPRAPARPPAWLTAVLPPAPRPRPETKAPDRVERPAAK